MKKERFCPSKKPYYETDKECYYHGFLDKCPYCGSMTKECQKGEYKQIKGYSLRDIGG
jgi:hypothetical protein